MPLYLNGVNPSGAALVNPLPPRPNFAEASSKFIFPGVTPLPADLVWILAKSSVKNFAASGVSGDFISASKVWDTVPTEILSGFNLADEIPTFKIL